MDCGERIRYLRPDVGAGPFGERFRPACARDSTEGERDREADSNTRRMIFRIPQLIETASQILTIEAGDVIATGSPAGVWPIVPGDRLEADIARVGTLRCTVAARNR